MSVVGISPTDIVKGIQFGRKTIRATGEGSAGSRALYRRDIDAIRARVRSLESLTSASEGASSAALDLYVATLNDDRCLQESLSVYDDALGPYAASGRRHGIRRKLQYAFSEATKVQEHNGTSGPKIDAVMLQMMLYVLNLSISSSD